MMELAILEALKSGNDIPVGAVVVKGGEIIASAHNEKEVLSDVTGHAEILAIRRAEQKLKNWRLNDCEMYVTLEPCPMCAWAIIQSRIKKIYFGSYNHKYGAFGSVTDLTKISDFKPQIYGGIEEFECNKILKNFWASKR